MSLGGLSLAAGMLVDNSIVVLENISRHLQAKRRAGADQVVEGVLEVTVLEGFCEASELLHREARTLLAKFGIGTEHVGRDAASLSPGERTRLSLALFQARGVNALILDEPTNHLDLPAIEQLESALDNYNGTVCLVSHDRALLEREQEGMTVIVRRMERAVRQIDAWGVILRDIGMGLVDFPAPVGPGKRTSPCCRVASRRTLSGIPSSSNEGISSGMFLIATAGIPRW